MTIDTRCRAQSPAARRGDRRGADGRRGAGSAVARHGGASRLPVLLLILVIALFIAVAIPIWQDQTVRGRVSEVLEAVADAPERLSAYVATQGELPVPADPALGAVLAAATAPERVEDASWSSDGGGVAATGVLTLTLAETGQLGAMSGATILMTATVIGGRQITWACAPGDPELAKFLPAACGTLFE